MSGVDNLVLLRQRLKGLQEVVLASWMKIDPGLIEEPQVTARLRFLLSCVQHGPQGEEMCKPATTSRGTNEPPADRRIVNEQLDGVTASVVPQVKREFTTLGPTLAKGRVESFGRAL